MGKGEKLLILFLIFLIGVFMGYFWKLYKDINSWWRNIERVRQEVLEEITAADNPVVTNYNMWKFIRRADGSVIVKKEEDFTEKNR